MYVASFPFTFPVEVGLGCAIRCVPLAAMSLTPTSFANPGAISGWAVGLSEAAGWPSGLREGDQSGSLVPL